MENLCRMGVLLAVMGIMAACSSQVYKFKPINMSTLQADRNQIAQLQKRYPEDKAVFLYREHTYEHVEVEFPISDWYAKQIVVLRYVVFDATSEPLSTFHRALAKGWVMSRVDIVVMPPDGRKQRFGREDLIEEKGYAGKKTYKLAYPKITNGTIIEERVEMYCSDPLSTSGIWGDSLRLSFNYPTLRAVAAFSFPKEWAVQIKKVSKNKNSFSVHESGGNIVVKTERFNLLPVTNENYSPYKNEDGDYLRFWIGSIQDTYHEKRTWEQQSRMRLKYVVDNDAVFSRKVTKQARRITKDAKTELEKFKAIVEYTQQVIQADVEFEKKDFADVLKTKRGGPWQVVGLAHQMAKKVGLDVRYIMIHSAKDGFFDKNFITPREPGDPAIMVSINGKEHIGFPSINWLPINTFPERFAGRPAYKIGPDGFDGFISLPVNNHEDRKVESRVSVKISEEGTLNIEEVVSYHGSRAVERRRSWADQKERSLLKSLRDALLYIQGDVTINSVKIVGLRENYKPLQIIYRYRIDNAVTLGPGAAILQSAGIFSSSVRENNSSTRKVRIRPIVSYSDSMYRRAITMELPDGWTVSNEPAPFHFKNRCGDVGIEFSSTTPGLLKVTKNWKRNRFSFPAKEYRDLKQYLVAQDKAIVPTLIFKTP